MEIKLEIATLEDTDILFEMQKKSFQSLLDKYQDFETNPANETVDNIKSRMNNGIYYKIFVENDLVGAVRVVIKGRSNWISPIFVLPEYQGKGIAQKAMLKIETLFPNAQSWELQTILQEKGNCYLYEKLGYKTTDNKIQINDRMTLVHYKK
ncbi:GNAT family N-acetyltransferase [Domibacillus sp. A3M-37]|uniref:GNAT family N-acetyltransferase n=1 Tax=Domibacillus sp. A3M-37 TaxID=2962037 RepID=UPI0020B82B79|nr:GNAT family N-acetyltransferase [Domibacillus sp. A3M-37]MCP3765060.1 GNAT family N-acetyltransferase [Domibacillus sp. A3M-37]